MGAGPPLPPEDEASAEEIARLERAAAFFAAHQDEALTPPLAIAGAVAALWLCLVGWQAVSWWPGSSGAVQISAGIGRIERDADGGMRALTVGEGLRFECARRGRWSWRVLYVPLVECRDADVLFAAAQGRNLHVRYDRPRAGGREFPRLLALTADGTPLWTPEDSAHAFGWQGIRAGLLAGLLLLPGWLLHRFWPRR